MMRRLTANGSNQVFNNSTIPYWENKMEANFNLSSFELLLIASYFANCYNSSNSTQSLPVAVKIVDDSQGICKEHIESDRHSSIEKL